MHCIPVMLMKTVMHCFQLKEEPASDTETGIDSDYKSVEFCAEKVKMEISHDDDSEVKCNAEFAVKIERFDETEDSRTGDDSKCSILQ